MAVSKVQCSCNKNRNNCKNGEEYTIIKLLINKFYLSFKRIHQNSSRFLDKLPNLSANFCIPLQSNNKNKKL